jgi:hypothetical protein
MTDSGVPRSTEGEPTPPARGQMITDYNLLNERLHGPYKEALDRLARLAVEAQQDAAARIDPDRLAYLEHVAADWEAIQIGSNEFMDPPDGGDVSLAEQVARMRTALDDARKQLAEVQQDRERLREISDCLFSEAANLEDFGNEATGLTQRVLRASVHRLRAYATTLRFDASRPERPTGDTPPALGEDVTDEGSLANLLHWALAARPEGIVWDGGRWWKCSTCNRGAIGPAQVQHADDCLYGAAVAFLERQRQCSGQGARIPDKGTTAEGQIADFLRERVRSGGSWERATSRMLDEFFRTPRPPSPAPAPLVEALDELVAAWQKGDGADREARRVVDVWRECRRDAARNAGKQLSGHHNGEHNG